MSRDQNEIPRSRYVFEPDDILRLMDIHRRHPWLTYENPTGLEDLWHVADNSSEDKELIEFLLDKFHYVDSNMLLFEIFSSYKGTFVITYSLSWSLLYLYSVWEYIWLCE